MFIPKDELEANETVQKCQADFPQLTEGKFYILRNEITAFDNNNVEGKITFDGYSGALVCFKGFSAQANAHFYEPVLSLQENGTLQNIDGVCVQSFYIPVSDLNAADFEPFNFAESEFMEPDDILIHAYSRIINKSCARTIIVIVLVLCGLVGVFVDAIFHICSILSIVSCCIAVIGVILMLCLNGHDDSKEIRKGTAAYRYKRLSSLRKYTESLGIDPCVSTFKGYMGVRLSKISEDNV